MNKIKLTLLLILPIFLLTACQDKEAGKLDNRVIEYWNLKINKDFKSAYQLLSPGWRSNESEMSFVQRMSISRVKWLNVKLNNKKCKLKNLCEVKVDIEYEYNFRGMMGKKMKVPTTISENWILKNNTWYHVPRETKF